jgi:DNA-binding NtrC family response regulator
MSNARILVIDDEQEMLVSYQKILHRAGYNAELISQGESALAVLDTNQDFSLVICDLKMPGMDGMEFLAHTKEKYPQLPVILVTGYGTLDLAIEAVKNGAFDFIEKPFSTKKLLTSIKNALNQIFPKTNHSGPEEGFDNIIGRSKGMVQIFEVIKKVAFGNSNVLITGESGVGKEKIARSIHKHSLRRNHPIIPINCAALPSQLFESELFGYEKGAFTGAFQSKPGLVELANGGTLFLDEVCEMPQMLQVKLLRMLEERKIRRIGGQEELPINIRLVSATNRDLEQSVNQGLLREDFYYRINTINIHVPPLRERQEDIPLLVNFFLTELNNKYNRNIESFHPDAFPIIQNYDWPGNVRELQNVIERCYYMATPPQIQVGDFPSYIKTNHTNITKSWEQLSYKDAKEIVLTEFEKDYLLLHLKKQNWNISKTAEICGIDRRTIHRLIKKYQLKSE